MAPQTTDTAVYFDGSCPLCRAEIELYGRQEGAQALSFVDVSDVSAAAPPLPDGLTRNRAMARFHVRGSDGQIYDGAAAFVQVWRALPRWRWLARLASLPGATAVLEFGYRLFLPVRPALSGLAGKLIGRRRAAG